MSLMRRPATAADITPGATVYVGRSKVARTVTEPLNRHGEVAVELLVGGGAHYTLDKLTVDVPRTERPAS